MERPDLTVAEVDEQAVGDDEGDDLIASFSGGWKMRIGLGKVLLKDPNVLLLDEVSYSSNCSLSWYVQSTYTNSPAHESFGFGVC